MLVLFDQNPSEGCIYPFEVEDVLVVECFFGEESRYFFGKLFLVAFVYDLFAKLDNVLFVPAVDAAHQVC